MAEYKIHNVCDWPGVFDLPMVDSEYITHDDYYNVTIRIYDSLNTLKGSFTKVAKEGYTQKIYTLSATTNSLYLDNDELTDWSELDYYAQVVYYYEDSNFADGYRAESNTTYIFSVVPPSESTNVSDIPTYYFGSATGAEEISDPTAIHINVANELSTVTEKTTFADGDVFLLEDSEAIGVKKKTLWSTIKSTLKTYFDTLYYTIGQAFDTILFNSSYSVTGTEETGETYYDADNHTLSTVLEHGTILQHGLELLKLASDEGNDFQMGRAVSIKGVNGNQVAVELTDFSETSTNCKQFIGLLTSDIDSGNRYVLLDGDINNIDTTGGLSYGGLETWVENDYIWGDTTNAGYLTNVEPTGLGVHKRFIGVVTIEHTSAGRISTNYICYPNSVEIKEYYELNPDTNALTDAYKTILDNTSGTNTGDQDLSTYQLKPSEGAFENGDKTKLDGIENKATADQTGAEIVSSIDSQLGSDEWQSGGEVAATEDTNITWTTAKTATQILAEINALPKNGGGYKMYIIQEDGSKNIDAQMTLTGFYNWDIIIEAETAISSAGLTQSSEQVFSGAYNWKFVGCNGSCQFNNILFTLSAGGTTLPFVIEGGNFTISTKYDGFDVSAATSDSHLFRLKGGKLISNDDTFKGNTTYNTTLAYLNDSVDAGRGGEVEVFNATYDTTKLTYAANGRGSIIFGGTNTAFTTDTVNDAVDKSLSGGTGTNEFYLDAYTVSNETEDGGQINGRSNFLGTIYWVVMTNEATAPTQAELIAGVVAGDLLASGTITINSGNVNTIVNDTVSGLSSATDYDIYLIAGDTIARNFSAMRFMELTTALSQLTAPALSSPTVDSNTQISVTITDNNTSPNEVNTLMQYKEQSSGTWLDHGYAAQDATSYSYDSLTASTAYDFRCIAQGDDINSLDSDPSNTVQETTSESYGTDFVFEVTVSEGDLNFTLPCRAVGTYNATIDWGDETQSTITTYDDADLAHSYSSAGTYTVRVSGDLPQPEFNNTGDYAKVTGLIQMGSGVLEVQLINGFYGCINITSLPTDSDSLTYFNTTLEQASNAFRGTGITSIPSGITFASVINANYMIRDTSVASAPDVNLASMEYGAFWAYNCTINTTDWSNILDRCSNNNINEGVSFHGGNSLHNSTGATAIAELQSRTSPWTVTDGGLES